MQMCPDIMDFFKILLHRFTANLAAQSLISVSDFWAIHVGLYNELHLKFGAELKKPRPKVRVQEFSLEGYVNYRRVSAVEKYGHSAQIIIMCCLAFHHII